MNFQTAAKFNIIRVQTNFISAYFFWENLFLLRGKKYPCNLSKNESI